MAARKKEIPVTYNPGDKVMYDKKEYQIVQLFGADGKYAVIFGQGKRISVETKRLEKK